jgi:D-alanine-D-alanine ligase
VDIVVLYGGLSKERDVSFSSGIGVAGALRSKGHRVVLMDVFFGYPGEYGDPRELFALGEQDETYTVPETEPDLEAVKARRRQKNDSLIGDNVLEICRAADITFLALHGEEGENGKLQACLDIAGIPYTGSGYFGSALAMNKTVSKRLFEAAGIPTPQSITLTRGRAPYADIGWPCVVKPCSGGSSVATSIVRSRAEYEEALEAAFLCEDKVIAERYIKGRELTVGVIDGWSMPVVEIIPKEGFYDYKNKYQAGLTLELCPAPIDEALTKRVQQLAEQVCQELMIDVYGRVDFIVGDEDGVIYCLEANTLPGMTPTSLMPRMAEAAGLDFGALCEKILEASLKKYGKSI